MLDSAAQEVAGAAGAGLGSWGAEAEAEREDGETTMKWGGRDNEDEGPEPYPIDAAGHATVPEGVLPRGGGLERRPLATLTLPASLTEVGQRLRRLLLLTTSPSPPASPRLATAPSTAAPPSPPSPSPPASPPSAPTPSSAAPPSPPSPASLTEVGRCAFFGRSSSPPSPSPPARHDQRRRSQRLLLLTALPPASHDWQRAFDRCSSLPPSPSRQPYRGRPLRLANCSSPPALTLPASLTTIGACLRPLLLLSLTLPASF